MEKNKKKIRLEVIKELQHNYETRLEYLRELESKEKRRLEISNRYGVNQK